MRAKIVLSLLVAFSVPHSLKAGRVQPWTYQEMLAKADLVVMAEWASTKDTDERAILPDTTPPIRVIGVETQFETTLIIKGPKSVNKLNLHHYRFQYDDEPFRPYAPQLVRILEPMQRDGVEYLGGGKFLLFLIREPDGRYAPVTGQTDPAVLSVLQLTVAVR